MLTTAMPDNGLHSYTVPSVRHTKYDRLSQQKLSFLFLQRVSIA